LVPLLAQHDENGKTGWEQVAERVYNLAINGDIAACKLIAEVMQNYDPILDGSYEESED
jgi:hypothetical protein